MAARYAHALAGNDGQDLDEVSHDFEAMGDALIAADAAAQAAGCYRLAGQHSRGLTAIARTQLLAKNCGGAVSPALASARVALPFTRREHEIAQLVSNSMSNREIAQAMFVTVRTIEGHIYKASSRQALPRAQSSRHWCSSFRQPTLRQAIQVAANGDARLADLPLHLNHGQSQHAEAPCQ